MSGVNTKDSKLSRILARQVESNEDIQNIFALIRLGHETDLATIKLLTETAHRLEAENATLRKYLGSVLFQRRKVESIPTLSGELCSCAPGLCRGDWNICRHPAPLEPKWGNHVNELPHNTKGTI